MDRHDGRAIGSGALAIAASVVVIWIHHIGYLEFRHTRRFVIPIVGCGVLSLACMLTFSRIAPVAGHFLLHAGMETRGVPMPPYSNWARTGAPGALAPA